jgi:hypothetical protein
MHELYKFAAFIKIPIALTKIATELAKFENGQLVLKAQKYFEERIIGPMRSNEEDTLAWYSQRYEQLQQKVAALKHLIDSNENKGSFLVKLTHLKSQLYTYDAVGDFDVLLEELNRYEQLLEDYVAHNRQKNLDLKRVMLEELRNYAANPNWKEATEQIKELRKRWIRVGAVSELFKQEIEEEFEAIVSAFFEKKKEFYEHKQQLIHERVRMHQELLQQMEDAAKTTSITFEQLSQFRESWKAMENIPKEQLTPLLERFKKLSADLHRKLPKGDLGVNQGSGHSRQTAKKQLLIDAKSIAEQPSVSAADLERIKQLQANWKAAPKAVKNAVQSENDDFYFWCDLAYEKHFVFGLAAKKCREEKELPRFVLRLVYDLLQRDQRELETYEENAAKFNLGGLSLDKMVNLKLQKQRRKVAVKQHLIAELKKSEK